MKLIGERECERGWKETDPARQSGGSASAADQSTMIGDAQ
jgi:hypothetical protein